MANAPEIPLYSPGYAGATALGGTPTTPVPMAPPGSTAPEAPQQEDAGVSALGASGGGATLADRMKASGSPFLPSMVSAATALAKSDPQAAAAPGGWARTLLGATMHGLAPEASTIANGLGNAANIGEIPKGSGKLGGAFVGISRALNAGNEQAAQQKQQKFENQQKTEELDLRKQNQQALMAESHLRQLQLEGELHKQSEDVRKSGMANTQNLVKFYADQGYHQDLLSYTELQKVSKEPGFWDNHVGGKITEVPELNSEGKETGRWNPQYAVIDLRTKPPESKNFEVDEAYAKEASDAGIDIPVGTRPEPPYHNYIDQKIKAYKAQQTAMYNANGEYQDAKMREQLRPDLQNPTVQNAMLAHNDRPMLGLSERIKTTENGIKTLQAQIATKQQRDPNDPSIKTDQDALAKNQSADDAMRRVLSFGFNDKAKEQERAFQIEDEKIAHDRAEEAIQDKRAEVAAKKGLEDKQLQTSYGVQNKEFDLIRKPLATQLDSFSTLRNSLDQGTAVGDSVVAPALLKALVAGGGVRITQAEIAQFTHGRSTLEDMKGYLMKMQSGKSITPVQRQQVYQLLGAVEAKAGQKKSILEDAQTNLDQAETVEGQRAAVRAARTRLDALDKPEQQKAPAAGKLPPAPAGMVTVQIPGYAPRAIPQGALAQFKADHKDAIIGQ